MIEPKKKIVVGMSGGVDSSVAAYLLQQQGWDVHGVFMKNWEDTNTNPTYRSQDINGCSWEQDFADVRAVCTLLDIPYSTFNFVEEYKEKVFGIFLDELNAGRTPNPDIICNQEIKFYSFLKKAMSLPDVTAIATGHYAKIEHQQLMRPADTSKDQTYFLYRMQKNDLPLVLFPLQNMQKKEVREIAKQLQLPNADKKDSTGICFIGDIDYNQFIAEHIPENPGKICTKDGSIIGEHRGLHFFTLGQRKGVDIGGTGPYYVVRKEYETNRLIVTNDKDDSDLFQQSCEISALHWIEDVQLPLNCQVQVRYHQHPQNAKIRYTSDNTINILFDVPQRSVTPGQSAVLYDNDVVLGGGVIVSAT